MSWEWRIAIGLAVIVLALVQQIWFIRKHLNLDDWTPTRKWMKQFNGSRRVSKHQPDRIPENADENEQKFFRETSMIAHWLNDLYANTPWSFDSTGELFLQNQSENGAERKIELWYNQVKTGWISVSKIRMNKPVLHVELSLINSRCYPGLEVIGIATSLAKLVSETPEVLHEAQHQIQSVMIDNMWQLPRDFGNPSFEVRFTGQLADHLLPSSSHWQNRRQQSACQEF